MKIISYNLNGIRAAITKGFATWLATENPDIICIQETKAEKSQVDESIFTNLGYHTFWHSAEKKGYSGVAIFSKIEPKNVITGCGINKYDIEGRVLRMEIGDLTIINTYFPSGTSGDERQNVKMCFLEDYFNWIQELKKTNPKLIVCGDYNICHTEIDIHDPKGNKKNSGFLPEEREWMTKWFESGMVDSFRYLNPNKLHAYSWWSQRFPSVRLNNKGWRIDYISTTENLKQHISQADILPDVKHSDHCPVYITLEH